MTAYVAPAFINRETQLGTIDDVFNGILVRGDATGDVVFYGKGAGKLPTASAVVSDMIACAKADGSSASMSWKPSQGGNVAPQGDHVTAMYLRCRAFETNALEEAVKIFGKVKALSRPDKPTNEAAFITPALTEREIDDVAASWRRRASTSLERFGCWRINDQTAYSGDKRQYRFGLRFDRACRRTV